MESCELYSFLLTNFIVTLFVLEREKQITILLLNIINLIVEIIWEGLEKGKMREERKLRMRRKFRLKKN